MNLKKRKTEQLQNKKQELTNTEYRLWLPEARIGK